MFDALVSSGHFQESLRCCTNSIRTGCCRRTRQGARKPAYDYRARKRNTGALETLLDLFHKAGENTHLTEVYELLAHAYVQSGDLEKARDYYLKFDATGTAKPVALRQLSAGPREIGRNHCFPADHS